MRPNPCWPKPGGPSGNPWAPHLPHGWQIKRLKHLAEVRSGIAKGKDNDGRETVELPYLRVANVQDGHLALDDEATIEVDVAAVDRYSLQPGDLLMNAGGDYDKVGRGALWHGQISPCLHQNHVFAVRPVDPALSEWLAPVTLTQYAKFYLMNNAKQSTNLASISQSNLKELPVLLPPPKSAPGCWRRRHESRQPPTNSSPTPPKKSPCSRNCVPPPSPMRCWGGSMFERPPETLRC